MKTILAIDSFKGCMSSSEVEETIAGVLNKNGVETLCLPMSDGGEGMLPVFTSAMGGNSGTRIYPRPDDASCGCPIRRYA